MTVVKAFWIVLLAVSTNLILFLGLAFLNLLNSAPESGAAPRAPVRIVHVEPSVPEVVMLSASAPVAASALEPELPTVSLGEPDFSAELRPLEVAPLTLSSPVVDDRSERWHVSADTSKAAPLSAESVDRPPRALTTNEEPTYPSVAARHGWEGTVIVKLLIDENGRVRDPQILELDGHDVFRKAVLEVVNGWRYEPAQHGGRNVDVWTVQPFQFQVPKN